MSETAKAITESAATLATQLQEAANTAASIAMNAGQALTEGGAHGEPYFIMGLTVFVLACFVGYHVVWSVTPALHSPLMGITNAISSVIIVGAVMATGVTGATGFSALLGFLAVTLASVNIFGGFIITRRMLHMFKKKG